MAGFLCIGFRILNQLSAQKYYCLLCALLSDILIYHKLLPAHWTVVQVMAEELLDICQTQPWSNTASASGCSVMPVIPILLPVVEVQITMTRSCPTVNLLNFYCAQIQRWQNKKTTIRKVILDDQHYNSHACPHCWTKIVSRYAVKNITLHEVLSGSSHTFWKAEILLRTKLPDHCRIKEKTTAREADQVGPNS